MRNHASSKGVTLIEIMIGLLVMTIAFTSLATVFTSISKSILVNKTKTIAMSLAQEKMESLKDLSYYKLLVTTAVAPLDTNFPDSPGMFYDKGTTRSYYPEENLYVGGLSFKRRVFVEFLGQVGQELVGYPAFDWTSNDLGVKRITIYVVWEEGIDWKMVELRSKRNNPDRATLDHTFTGVITSGTTGSPLYNVLVETIQNPSYFKRTDSGGNYSFKVQPGSYTLRATATGYFSAISTNYVVSAGQTGSDNQNFGLTLMAHGEATGYAYIRDHLVITQVVADYDFGAQTGQEWVELYNPTTYSILIASKSSSSDSYDLFHVTVTWIDNGNLEPFAGNQSRYLLGSPDADGSVFTAFRTTSTLWDTRFSSESAITIPSHAFFLIANYSTVTIDASITKIADAYYTLGDGSDDRIDTTGGIRVTGYRGHSYNSRTDWHDGFGWGNIDVSKAYETSVNNKQLEYDKIFYRVAYKYAVNDCPNTQTRDIRNLIPVAANNFDINLSGINCGSGSDFDKDVVSFHLISSNSIVNADTTFPPYTGAPAVSASVSADDGTSSVALADTMGFFSLTNMATGTWTVSISSAFYTREISTVTITPYISTGIPNNSTDPRWEHADFSGVGLSSTTLYGYVSGTVYDVFNNGLSGVTVSADITEGLTNSQGRYRLSIEPAYSPVNISASKTGFSTELQSAIAVTLGIEVSGVDFTMVSAGSIKGFVTTNGTPSGALPGVPVVAHDLSSTTIMGSAVTGVDGNFTILSIDTGTYIVAPQLEDGESSSPTNTILNVTVSSTGTWSSTFTVSNAFGEITGEVSEGSDTNLITTGVLIVASTTPITGLSPPDMDLTLRDGGQIYYAISSNARGVYNLPVRGGSSYYVYGWNTSTLDVVESSVSKIQVITSTTIHWVDPGTTIERDIQW